MSSIFPFTDPVEINQSTKFVPRAKEYAYNFYAGDFRYVNGKPYFVYDKEAVKIWIQKALLTRRYKENIFTWNFGAEFEDKLIGRGYSKGLVKSEAERYTREAIESCLSDYVTDLRDFDIEFMDNTLTIAFTAETIYGEVRADVQL